MVPEAATGAIVGVAADAGICVVDSGVDLHEFAGSIRGRLPDGRALVDERNLPPVSTWTAPGRPIATVSAIGREAVTDPTIFDRAVDAVASVDADMVWWSHGETLTFAVARSAAPEAERALHEAIVPPATPPVAESKNRA